MIIRTNVTTRRNFDANGNEFASRMPRISYKNTERVEWHLYSKTPLENMEGVDVEEWEHYTGFADGGIGAFLTSDNNFTHRIKGTLAADVPVGAVESVVVTFSKQSNATIKQSGSITLFAENGDAETVSYVDREFSGDNCTFTFVEGTELSREYAAGAIVDTAEAVYMQAVMNAEESDPNNGIFVFYITAFSEKLKQAIDYANIEFIDNKGLELAIFQVAGTVVTTRDRFVCDDFAIFSGIADTGEEPELNDEIESLLTMFVNACIAVGLEIDRRVLEDGSVEIRTRLKGSGGAWSEWIQLPVGPQGIPGTGLSFATPPAYSAEVEYQQSPDDGYNVCTDQGGIWLYINAAPGSGNAPPTLPTTSNDHWSLIVAPGATPEIDETPTEGSSNLITSGAVYAALGDIQNILETL